MKKDNSHNNTSLSPVSSRAAGQDRGGADDRWRTRGYLPHLDASVYQHITYRLADSLPRALVAQARVETLESCPDVSGRKAQLRDLCEAMLDEGHGSCILAVPEVARCVIETWRHFDGRRYSLLEWVVMPSHCHVLIKPFEGVGLARIVLSWKNYTARFINDYKRRTGVRRSRENTVWHREYWDRYIRDNSHLDSAREYIAMNPVRAGLAGSPSEWPWSSSSTCA